MAAERRQTSRPGRSSASSTATSSGQNAAKRAVAIALRNRWRRQQVAGELRDEIYPKNIILIGPTGVGKTEIARRLAKLAQAPFVKVEASQVHRGRLRGPRRRVDGPRPGRGRHRAGARGGDREGPRARRRGRRGPAGRAARRTAARPPARRRLRLRAAAAAARDARRTPSARSCAPSCAPARSTTSTSRSRSPTPAPTFLQQLLRAGHGGDRRQPAGPVQEHARASARTRKRKVKVPEALKLLDAGGGRRS